MFGKFVEWWNCGVMPHGHRRPGAFGNNNGPTVLGVTGVHSCAVCRHLYKPRHEFRCGHPNQTEVIVPQSVATPDWCPVLNSVKAEEEHREIPA